MKRSIEEKTGSSLSADNSARLQELANIQNAMTSGDAMQKYSMPEMQTQTNELARMGGFAGSVASPKAEQINQQIANYTKEQNDLLKKANELIAKIGDLK
jgi:phosphoribulokinase